MDEERIGCESIEERRGRGERHGERDEADGRRRDPHATNLRARERSCEGDESTVAEGMVRALWCNRMTSTPFIVNAATATAAASASSAMNGRILWRGS